LDRDDWKWMDEEDMKEFEEEEGEKKAEGEWQCPRCTHWLAPGAVWCGYCGSTFEEKPKKG
jgi:uncharacterized OB-fold protein